MRLFVAVRVAEEVVAAAEDVGRLLRGCVPRESRVTWVAPANLHLTVRFIGHVPDDDAPRILEVLRPPLKVGAFDVELGSCGVFPRSGPPRVIWIGLAQGVPRLAAIHEELDRRLHPLGFQPEAREFNVHLTLARIKDAPGTAGRKIRDCVSSARAPAARWSVTSATVFQSVLSPHGPTYRPLFEIPAADR